MYTAVVRLPVYVAELGNEANGCSTLYGQYLVCLLVAAGLPTTHVTVQNHAADASTQHSLRASTLPMCTRDTQQ